MKFSDLYIALGFKDDKFKRGIKGAQSRTKQFTNQIKVMGGAIAAAFSVRAIGNFLKKSVELYDVQVKSEAKLLTALKGRSDLQESLIRQAGKLQEATLYGDEKTIEAQARLASLGLEYNAIKRLIPLVQDLATAKQMDLAMAAELVAKSVGSSTNAMSRYGINIEGAVGSTERLESAIYNLNKQVGGQAVAAAEAGTGAWQQLGNTWGDVMELVGKGLAPALNSLGTALKDVLGLMKDMSTSSISWWKRIALMINPTNIEIVSQIAEELAKEEYLNSLRDQAIEKKEEILSTQRKINEALKKQTEEASKYVIKLSEINSLVPPDRTSGGGLGMKSKTYSTQLQTIPFRTDTSNIKTTAEDFEYLGEVVDSVNSVMVDFSSQLVKSLDLASTGFEGFMSNMADTIMKLIAMLLSNSIANAIAGATASGTATGPAAIFTTPAFIATAVGGVLSAFAAIPKFATGGILGGTSFSGDNLLFRGNSGEMVLNGHQQRNLFDMINSGGGGNFAFDEVKVRGSDLILAINNTNKKRSTVR